MTDSAHVRALLGRWSEFGRFFVGPDGAIIAHTASCLHFILTCKGIKAKNEECTCKAFKAAETLLGLVRATKAEIDRLDNPYSPIYASPCADCRDGSMCHWDDTHTPGPKETPEEWAKKAAGLECQRCPCKGFKRVESKPT